MPWPDGVTFYACPCGAQSDTHAVRDIPDPPPLTLPCWGCKGGTMKQWAPSRRASPALSGRE